MSNDSPPTGGDRLKAAATGREIAVQQKSIFSFLDDPKVQQKLAVVASKHLRPERMLSLCVNAVKKTPLLMKCDPRSVLGAMMTSTALGLEPNTIQQQAFLIPYKKRTKRGGEWVDVYDCQFQVGARGFITLAYRTPDILSFEAEAIHAGDHWKHMRGSKSFLEYSKALSDRGELIGSFSFVALAGGRELACVLPLDELHKIREKSEAFTSLRAAAEKAAREGDSKERERTQRKLDETPWVAWEDDMAAKSAIKKHAKQLPLASSESPLVAAAEVDSRSDEGVIDMAAMTDPDVVRGVVNDGYEPPPAEDEDDGGSGEAYGGTVRAAASDQLQEKAANNAARGAEAEAKATEKKAEAVDDEWEPTPAQRARILAMEKAEAESARVVETQAPAPAPAAPAAAPAAVRRRSTNLPPME